MKLNKKLEIGINAVNILKTKTTATRTSDLALEIGTTVNFLEQIMRNLRTAGIVTVKRGPGGGYSLNRETFGNVTALDVANAVGRNISSTTTTGGAPVGRLNQAIVDAFVNTVI